ncbi:unnamed protein product [Urochloa decumbens]|uniref:SHSP domain-containing protein n=1 Tax=Urochloa decumbens TaxID=240449 RepID=A0ABC8YJ66_9POAL
MANNRVFEEFDPSVEWSRGAELDSVRISLPGFKREDIRVLVDSHGHLRTRGERPIAGARWSRFQKDFQLPDGCNLDGIRAKFEAETLIITLPKKTPSPPVPEPPRRPVAAAPSQRIPPPPARLPEPPARPAPPAVPAAPLAPAAAAPKRPPAERRPSLPRKPSITEPTAAPELPARLPSVPTPAHLAAAKPDPAALAAAAQKAAKEAEEERKRMEREMMGKMAEDTKAAQEKEKAQEQRDEAAAAMGEMAMARQPRPASASRGLLMNVAVAVVVLLGITVYVWHNLRNAAGGAGHLGAGSYGDEM